VKSYTSTISIKQRTLQHDKHEFPSLIANLCTIVFIYFIQNSMIISFFKDGLYATDIDYREREDCIGVAEISDNQMSDLKQ